jgi:hypothetical protein
MILNKAQRIIIAVVMPLTTILLGWGIMNWTSHDHYTNQHNQIWWKAWHFSPEYISESWFGWMLVVLIIGAFEFWWFSTPTDSKK